MSAQSDAIAANAAAYWAGVPAQNGGGGGGGGGAAAAGLMMANPYGAAISAGAQVLNNAITNGPSAKPDINTNGGGHNTTGPTFAFNVATGRARGTANATDAGKAPAGDDMAGLVRAAYGTEGQVPGASYGQFAQQAGGGLSTMLMVGLMVLIFLKRGKA